jgi:hypothetical protein
MLNSYNLKANGRRLIINPNTKDVRCTPLSLYGFEYNTFNLGLQQNTINILTNFYNATTNNDINKPLVGMLHYTVDNILYIYDDYQRWSIIYKSPLCAIKTIKIPSVPAPDAFKYVLAFEDNNVFWKQIALPVQNAVCKIVYHPAAPAPKPKSVPELIKAVTIIDAVIPAPTPIVQEPTPVIPVPPVLDVPPPVIEPVIPPAADACCCCCCDDAPVTPPVTPPATAPVEDQLYTSDGRTITYNDETFTTTKLQVTASVVDSIPYYTYNGGEYTGQNAPQAASSYYISSDGTVDLHGYLGSCSLNNITVRVNDIKYTGTFKIDGNNMVSKYTWRIKYSDVSTLLKPGNNTIKTYIDDKMPGISGIVFLGP